MLILKCCHCRWVGFFLVVVFFVGVNFKMFPFQFVLCDSREYFVYKILISNYCISVYID